MGIGVSVFLIAAGAVMAFALDAESSSGVDLNTIGVILMVVGAIGLVFTALIWGPRSRSTTVVEERPGGRI